MAEKGAHITQTAKAYKSLPSFFDAIATDTLNSYEAIKKLVDILCQEKRLSLLKYHQKYFTEIFFCCNAFVQHYYLKNYGASLAEFFYGLSRKNNKTNRFAKKDYYCSLMTLVFLPYVHEKLKTYMDNLDGNNQERRKYKTIHNIYNNITILFEMAKLLQFLGFFSRKASTCLLSHQLLNLRLEYVESGITEYRFQDILNNNVSLSKVISDLFFRALGVSAFFLQFIQSFQNELQYKKIDILESPEIYKTNVIQNEICPICLHATELPTVVQVSGYVYCYKCINLHLQNRGNYCPITNYSASMEDLITLYEEK